MATSQPRAYSQVEQRTHFSMKKLEENFTTMNFFRLYQFRRHWKILQLSSNPKLCDHQMPLKRRPLFSTPLVKNHVN